MKNWSAGVIAAVANDNPRTELLQMDLAGGSIYLTTAGHDIDYNGNTYISSGLILDAGSINQQSELRVQSFSIQFTAADQSIVALFLNNNQQNRSITFTQVVLTNKHQVIGEVLQNRFIIDALSIDDDEEEATITVEMSNYLSNFESVGGITTTQASFARFYPRTTSFINSKDIDEQLIWGGK